MQKSDAYLKLVEWSEEDQCYVGSCPGLMIGGVHGKNEAQVYKQLCHVVNEWIKIYEEDGAPLPAATANKEFSGKFMLRPGKSLHKSIAIAALHKGESLNNFCIKALKAHLPNQFAQLTSPDL
ncbi:MAG: toxin-antitoxin system HicB family antitoxin [Nitrospirota bacterium]